MRLVSLRPSATETVHALGRGDDLVGVTFECDEPQGAWLEKTVVVGGVAALASIFHPGAVPAAQPYAVRRVVAASG